MVYTGPVPAQVIELKPFWYRTLEVLIHETVCNRRLLQDTEVTIASAALDSQPVPTPVLVGIANVAHRARERIGMSHRSPLVNPCYIIYALLLIRDKVIDDALLSKLTEGTSLGAR